MSHDVADLPEYLVRLDETQRKAALDTDGYVAIYAGAGAGKSAVLAARVAHLVDDGVDPESILSLTFTNKAADEMRTRIESYIGTDVSGMWIGTYHSVCARILRAYGHEIGIPATFSIYDVGDSALVLRRVFKEQWIYPREAKKLMARIQQFKSQLEDMDSWCEHQAEDEAGVFHEVYESYAMQMRAANALDFDDLTRETVRLITRCPAVLSELGRQFRYICVDEYQDTSRIETELLQLLSSYHDNLCVVGDVRQSIFRWRNSDYHLLLDFDKTYPESRRHVLSTN